MCWKDLQKFSGGVNSYNGVNVFMYVSGVELFNRQVHLNLLNNSVVAFLLKGVSAPFLPFTRNDNVTLEFFWKKSVMNDIT